MASQSYTLEDVWALFAETSKKFAETDRKFAETRQFIQETTAKTDQELQQTSQELRSLAAKTDAELRTLAAKTDAELRTLAAKTDAELRQTSREIRALARQVGEVTDSMGRLAEEQIRPRILEMFRAKGIILEETIRGVRVEKNGKFLLEIDLLLVNTIFSVVVEVKNTLRQRDVEEHLERLKKLQETPSRVIKGTTMYGAVAGMVVTPEVEKFAIKKGLYVIKPKGESVEISNGIDFQPKTWEVKNN